MAVRSKKGLQKAAVICLASLIAIIVVVILAIAMFAKDPIEAVRGCYVFLKTKIAEK
jgi:hypothetical protein